MIAKIKIEPVWPQEEELFDKFEYIFFALFGKSKVMIYRQDKKNGEFEAESHSNQYDINLHQMNKDAFKEFDYLTEDELWPGFWGAIDFNNELYSSAVNSFINQKAIEVGNSVASNKNIDKSKIGIVIYLDEGGHTLDSLENCNIDGKYVSFYTEDEEEKIYEDYGY